jgi:hypothetical protein
MNEEENYAETLKLQQQEEEDEKFLQQLKDNSMDMLTKSLDAKRNADWLIQYFIEQKKLHIHNHNACVEKVNKKYYKDGRIK